MNRKIPPYFNIFVPESSRITSPASIGASKNDYTDKNSGKIWFLENGKVSNVLKERFFPRIDEDENPIYITAWLAREWATREFIKNDKKLSKTANSAWWTSFQNRSYANSTPINMINKILGKEGKAIGSLPLSGDPSIYAGKPTWGGQGIPVASICLAGNSTKDVSMGKEAYKIPSCMNREWYPELEFLNLKKSSIKTITGMDKMKVKKLALPEAVELIDPDGLPKNLTSIDMSSSKMTELKGFEKRDIEEIDARYSEIQFINPDGVPKTLKRIELSGSKLRTLGGLNKTDVKKIDAQSTSPGISIIDQSGLPPGLEVLKVKGSPALEKVPNLDALFNLSQLDFSGNANLKEIGRLSSAAETLDVSSSGIRSLGDLHYLSLREIYAADCKKLTKIDPKELPSTLKSIWLVGSGFARKKGGKQVKCEELQSQIPAKVVC